MLRLFRVVAGLIQSGLDVVLPRKERAVRIDGYAHEDIPVSPTEHVACGIHILTLTNYREQIVEDLIRAAKYDGGYHAAKLLSAILAEYLREETASLRAFSTAPIVLTPIPLYPSRERERGFNQITRILNALPAEFHDGTVARIDTGLLVRIRETAQQTRLSREERHANVRGAFAITNAKAVHGAHVFVIDDVTTTGATLAEAVRPFTDIGIRTSALAIARA